MRYRIFLLLYKTQVKLFILSLPLNCTTVSTTDCATGDLVSDKYICSVLKRVAWITTAWKLPTDWRQLPSTMSIRPYLKPKVVQNIHILASPTLRSHSQEVCMTTLIFPRQVYYLPSRKNPSWNISATPGGLMSKPTSLSACGSKFESWRIVILSSGNIYCL